MISMQLGLAATASLNWLIMVPGSHWEYCALRSMPKAAAAAFAPFSRASVAPSPDVPPIWKYMVSPLPSGSSASAGAVNVVNAVAARRILIVLMRFLTFLFCPYLRPGAADCVCFSAEPSPPEAREESDAPMRLIDVEIEDNRDEKDEAAHGIDPRSREPRGHQARLDNGDDEAAEHGADDRCTATEDRRAADQHGGDGDQEIALPLIAEIVLDLHRLEDCGDRSQKAHHREELDLLPLDVNADDARDRVRIADEQRMLAEAVAIEHEPHEDDDQRRPKRLDREPA